jgi:hypothetical protein
VSAQRIRISSRALGRKDIVTVYVYDTVEELRVAGTRWVHGVSSGTEAGNFEDAQGITHYVRRFMVDEDGNESATRHVVIIRLHRGNLGSSIVTHEIVHAGMALYGTTLPRARRARQEFHAANEPVAYLISDLTKALVERLYALGYYG